MDWNVFVEKRGNSIMDDRVFRDAMGKFTTGVTIVSTEHDGETMGMTVNAFMSVSLDPKLIAISIDKKARLYNKLADIGKFGLSILSEDQKEISMIFAKQMKKDREISFTMQDNVPVIEDSIVTLSCQVKDTVLAGDHKIFIAEVTELNINEADPILFHSGKYCTINPS